MFGASTSTRHLHFCFHMSGSNMGSLRLETLGSSGWTHLWSRSGDQGVQWQPALVTLPPNALALRFVGTTGNNFRSDMALDAIGAGFPTVEFHELTCSFRFDTCLWYNNGAASWQLAVGEGSENGKWVEAGNSSHSYVLETAAMFNVTEEKMLLFGYQLLGSEFVALEVQHQTAAGDWQRLFLASGSGTAVWRHAAVTITFGTVGLRFVANLTSEVDVVRVDYLETADTVAALANISCSFEWDSCGWRGNWQRHSGPTPSDNTGPDAAFAGETYLYVEGDSTAGQARGFRLRAAVFAATCPFPTLQEVTYTSPHFPKTVNTSYLEFAYHMRGYGIGLLELRYLREGGWTTRWSRRGSQGSEWLQAKVGPEQQP